MNDTQKKLYGLLESYLEYCKEYGYTDFKFGVMEILIL